MEAEDPLSELADIHLPDAVSAWPPAPGWWLLAALVLLALALLLRRLLAQLVAQRRQRYALRELEQIHAAWLQADLNNPAARNTAGLNFLYGCNSVLKRVALVFHPSADVANLNGAAWLAFLDRTLGGDDFCQGAGRALGDGAYRPAFDADADALHDLCRRWISHSYQHKGQMPAQAGADATTANDTSGAGV